MKTLFSTLPVLLFLLAGRLLAAENPPAKGALTYEGHVRPILKAHCFACHGEGEKLQGNLDVRLARLIAKGGDSGAALVVGKPAESILLARVQDKEMPPGDKKLSPAEVAIIERWIAGGANTARPEPENVAAADAFTEEERSFWSFQPVRRAPLPAVRDGAEPRTPIDFFLLAKLESHNLSFSAEADKSTLLRRLYFDLIGLPPSPENLAEFLADSSPDAYERLVDRLLASPAYGERWGRHWLDVAGYADSDGYTSEDPVRKYAYKYRDYVIRSFNAGKPFDRFIQEQLAGDEMVAPPHANLSQDAQEKLIATGFLRMAPDGTGVGGADQNLARNQVMAETLKIVSTSLLGLSVGCAQCHNHRYDPVPQADYYRLRAVFEPAYDWKNWRPPQARLVSLYTDADRAKSAQIEAEAAKLDAERTKKQNEFIERTFEKELAKLGEEKRESVRVARNTAEAQRTPEQKQLLKEHPAVLVSAGSLYLYDAKAAEELKKDAEAAAKLRGTKPVEEFISALTEVPGQLPKTFLFSRGDHDQPKQELAPGTLSVLATSGTAEIPAHDPALPTSGRRTALARDLTNGKHPLTARVLVNRVWMHHFGKGLVGTPADFGFLGDRPSHSELLDWLADELVSQGWDLKHVHRLILDSAAYRQQSRRTAPAAETIDPENRLLWRMNVRRLEAETLRDTILATSGNLFGRMHGPPVPVMEDDVGQIVVGQENLNGENRPGDVIPLHGEEYRRSIYIQVRRSRPLAVLDTFDAPAMEPNCEIRASSTVAPQSLLLMNSKLVVAQAEDFARRVRATAGEDVKAQLALACKLALAREPSERELTAAVAFLVTQAEQFAAKPPADPKALKLDPTFSAMANFCQALLSSNGFLYVD